MAGKDELKKGKALSGLSAALIVYSLAGGNISGSGNIFGTAVSIQNTDVVEVSIIILLCYLAYRYWMKFPNPFKELDKSSLTNVQSNKFFRNYIEQFKIDKLKEFKLANPKYNEVDNVGIHSSTRTTYIDKDGGGYYIRLEFRRRSELVTTRQYQISYWKYYLGSFFTYFYKEDFWVILLPWILFTIAMLLVILKTFGIDVAIPPTQ